MWKNSVGTPLIGVSCVPFRAVSASSDGLDWNRGEKAPAERPAPERERQMKIALAAVGSIACVSIAHAGIIGVAGDTEWIATPADARLNALTNDKVVRVWNEQQNISLHSSLDVDISGTPGRYDGNGDLGDFVIAQGMMASSHYVHFDSPGNTSASAKGSIRFDADIIGVIVRGDDRSDGRNRLDQSDWLSAGTLYSNGVNNRGLELSANEFVEISPDRRTISFSFRISNPGDFVRVITGAVPTPGSLVLAGMGLVAVGRRRR